MGEFELPQGFRLSQRALEDYTACPRRFYLRYLRHLHWPTPPQDEEAHLVRMRRGARFHRLVQRHLLGLPADLLRREAESDPDLARWWRAYLRQAPPEVAEGRRYVEQLLTVPFDGLHLVARYDLILIAEGSALIVDWKTAARAADLAELRRRWQTRLYRYLLARAGAALNGGQPIPPERITLLYWYAAVPAERRLPYSRADFEQDEADLHRLVAELTAAGDEAAFPPTDDASRCRFCPYRSYCFGTAPQSAQGVGEEDEGDWEAWDFDQIAEIAY